MLVMLGASAGLAYSSLSIVFIYVLLGSLLAATVLPILFTQVYMLTMFLPDLD